MTDHTQIPPDGETGPVEAGENGDNNAGRARYVRTLLIVVITLGLILLGGAAIVIGTIIKRVSDSEGNVPVKPGFGETQIELPAGSVLDEVIAADGRLILRLRDKAEGGHTLILLDPRRGEERGRIRLKQE